MQTTMAQALPQSTSQQNARVVRMEPNVKSAETRKLFNAGVSASAQIGKSADPICYNAPVSRKRLTRRLTPPGCLTSEQEMTMLTMKQLRKFVKIRNKSGYTSNLQFQIDANEAGFEVKDLGDVERFKLDGFTGYRWLAPAKEGNVMVIEFGSKLYLNDDDDADTRSMMSLMHKAVWETGPFSKPEAEGPKVVVHAGTGRNVTKRDVAARFE